MLAAAPRLPVAIIGDLARLGCAVRTEAGLLLVSNGHLVPHELADEIRASNPALLAFVGSLDAAGVVGILCGFLRGSWELEAADALMSAWREKVNRLMVDEPISRAVAEEVAIISVLEMVAERMKA